MKNESRVLMFVITTFLLIEVILNYFIEDLSENYKQIIEHPNTANKISASSNNTILFIGNSLIGNAVDIKQLELLYEESGLNTTEAYFMIPDNTNIWDWYCVLKNNFITHQGMPDILINGFAWDQLSDTAKPFPSRLGNLFCKISDIPDLYNLGFNKFSYISEFLVAKITKLYAYREAISKEIFTLIIPYYIHSTRLINDNMNANTRRDNNHVLIYEYKLLKKIINNLEKANTKTIFISMPVIDDYMVTDKFNSVIADSESIYLDYRKNNIFIEELFRDPIHLNEKGREIFTKFLFKDIVSK